MIRNIRRLTAVIRVAATVFVSAFIAVPLAKPQAFKVIYSFGRDTAQHPIAGLTIDSQGNLYGTSAWGGDFGAGTVYELRRTSSGFVYSTLHSFAENQNDGGFPWDAVTIGPDGTLYGTTGEGGISDRGTVFNLRPSCHAGSCSWNETLLYRFPGGDEGRNPQSGVVFDENGNLYGAVVNAGSAGDGLVYELTPSQGAWKYQVLYTFTGGQDGANPSSPLLFDSAGNLYGTAATGGLPGCAGFGCGTVYELRPSGSGWKEHTLYSFHDGDDGAQPAAGLVRDASGNLYGATCCGDSTGGTVFELSPSGGTWTFNLAYDFGGMGPGPMANLVRDSAGNLYGSSWGNGAYGQGLAFKLSPTNGGWTFASLHDFTGGTDGANAEGGLVMDSEGHLYGTTYEGGDHFDGVVFEITP